MTKVYLTIKKPTGEPVQKHTKSFPTDSAARSYVKSIIRSNKKLNVAATLRHE